MELLFRYFNDGDTSQAIGSDEKWEPMWECMGPYTAECEAKHFQRGNLRNHMKVVSDNKSNHYVLYEKQFRNTMERLLFKISNRKGIKIARKLSSVTSLPSEELNGTRS